MRKAFIAVATATAFIVAPAVSAHADEIAPASDTTTTVVAADTTTTSGGSTLQPMGHSWT